MIDQDVPNHLRRDAEEMSAALPLHAVLVDEAQEGFVDYGGALQGMIGAFASEIGSCETPQFLIYQRHQLIKSFLIALTPVDQ
jgi:hypothetical protein